jgi:hypothetical protein
MLFFELFPVLLCLLCVPVGIWLVAMDRRARQRPVAERTTAVKPIRRRP